MKIHKWYMLFFKCEFACSVLLTNFLFLLANSHKFAKLLLNIFSEFLSIYFHLKQKFESSTKSQTYFCLAV